MDSKKDADRNFGSSDCSSASDRKTVAVCTRMLPIGEKGTAVMIVDDTTTVGQINAWCDFLCQGKTVCLRLELVDQWQNHTR